MQKKEPDKTVETVKRRGKFSENIRHRIIDFFGDSEKLAFKITFIFSLLTHILMINGLNLLGGDALQLSLVYDSGTWEISLGRWGIQLIEALRFHIAIPIVTTTVCVFIVSICSVLLIRLLKMENKLSIILTSLIMGMSPVLTFILLYVYTADAYCFGLLFAILAVYSLYNVRNRWGKIISTMIFTTFSLSMYQSYLGFILGLTIVVSIIDLLRNEETKKLLKKLIKNMLIILAGCIFYLAVTFIILKLNNLSLADYKGAENAGFINTLAQISNSILTTYKTTFTYFFGNGIIANSNYYRDNIYACFFISPFILMLLTIYKKKIYKKVGNVVLMIILIVAMPIALDIIQIIMPVSGFHILEAYQFSLPLILGVMLIETIKWDKAILMKCMSVLSCSLILYTYYLQTNASYTAIEITHNQLYSVAIKISAEIENNSEHNPSAKICIVGGVDNSNLIESEEIYSKSYAEKSNRPLIDKSYYRLTMEKWQRVFNMYVGTRYNYCSANEYINIISQEEFKEMPVYPKEGYSKVIDGIIVVKLTNSPFRG